MSLPPLSLIGLPSLSVTVTLSPGLVVFGSKVISPLTTPPLVSSSLYSPLGPEPGSSSTSTVGVTLSTGLSSEPALLLPAGSVTLAFNSTVVSPGLTGTSTTMPLSRSSWVRGRSSRVLPSLSVSFVVSPTSVSGPKFTLPSTKQSLVSLSLYAPLGPEPSSRSTVTVGIILSTGLPSEPVLLLPAGSVTSTLSSTSVS